MLNINIKYLRFPLLLLVILLIVSIMASPVYASDFSMLDANIPKDVTYHAFEDFKRVNSSLFEGLDYENYNYAASLYNSSVLEGFYNVGIVFYRYPKDSHLRLSILENGAYVLNSYDNITGEVSKLSTRGIPSYDGFNPHYAYSEYLKYSLSTGLFVSGGRTDGWYSRGEFGFVLSKFGTKGEDGFFIMPNSNTDVDLDTSIIFSTTPIYDADGSTVIRPDDFSSDFESVSIRILSPNSSTKPISSYNLYFKFDATFSDVSEDFNIDDYYFNFLINDWVYLTSPDNQPSTEQGDMYILSTDNFTTIGSDGSGNFIIQADGYVNHYLQSNPLFSGIDNKLEIKLYDKNTDEVIASASTTFDVVRGFKDEDGDGLDDRTGQTYDEYVEGNKEPDYGDPPIDIGDFKNFGDFNLGDFPNILSNILGSLGSIFNAIYSILPPALMAIILAVPVLYIILRIIGR